MAPSKLFVPRKNYLEPAARSARQATQSLQARLRSAGIDREMSERLARAFSGIGLVTPEQLATEASDEMANYLAIERALNSIPSKIGSSAGVVVAPSNSVNQSRADVVLKGDASDATMISSLLTSNKEVFLLDGTVTINTTAVTLAANSALRGMGIGITTLQVFGATPPSAVNMGGGPGTLTDVSISSPNTATGIVSAGSLCYVERVQITGAPFGVVNTGTNCYFSDLNISVTNIGFRENGTQTLLSDTYITGGIWLLRVDSGTKGLVTGCLLGDGATDTAWGIYVAGGSGMTFSANSIQTLGLGGGTPHFPVEITGTATSGSSTIGNTMANLGAIHAVQIDAGAASHVVAYNNMHGYGAGAILDNGAGDVVTPNVT